VLGLVLAFSPACGGGDEEKEEGCASDCPFDYASFDGTAPVSFETDVFPIFRRSCGLSGTVCHGTKTKPDGELYMGPRLTCGEQPESDCDSTSGCTWNPTAGACENELPTDLAARKDIIHKYRGPPSKTAPAVNRVKPNEPENSFLMMKIDRCHCTAISGLTCEQLKGADSDEPCGDNMPQDGSRLDAAERDIIRRWISQGAQNN
jgi:hypothetical protein